MKKLFIIIVLIITFCGCSARIDHNEPIPSDVFSSHETNSPTQITAAANTISTTQKSAQKTIPKTTVSQPDKNPSQTTDANIHKGDLILINRENKYNYWDNPHLVNIYANKNKTYTVGNTDMKANGYVLKAFNSLMSDFDSRPGENHINIISAYRSLEYQKTLFENKVKKTNETEADKWLARSGHSEHHSGLAIDLGLYKNKTAKEFDGKGNYAWVGENCHKYGFIIRYTDEKEPITKINDEPWHLRYVGVAHAYYMKENNLCLEEYVEKLRSYNYDLRLKIQAAGKNYEVYYTQKTDAQIPKSGNYEISGNNIDGFIVTIG